MKISFRLFSLLTAFAAVASPLFAADRWSSDETAVRMGVNTWLSMWARPGATTGDPVVKTLYATLPSASLPAIVRTASRAGILPTAMNQPERFAIRVDGNRAVSSFRLPAPKAALGGASLDVATEVTLNWERRNGVWQIVQEAIAPVSERIERVALSEQRRK